jgi:diguanylate cyclase (GGDEF)-like protein
VFDVETLRMMVGVVSLTVLALFYLGVYRPTRSPFSGYWTVALMCAAASAVFLLGDGTPLQMYLNPASTATSAAGAICVWFATRSLHPYPNPWWLLIIVPLVCVVGAAFDEPATNDWAGNGLLFGVMAVAFSLGAIEVWRVWAARRAQPDARESGEAINALLVSALAATVMASMHVVRVVLFMVLGQDDPLFRAVVGSPTAAITLLLCLVAVTFSVSAIGWDQRTRDLRRRADEDDLTGLLGRSMFLTRAREAIAASGGRRGRQSWIVIADLDNFKPVNDEHGHLAGDRVLLHFADIARGTLRASDAVGRLGGDEFGFVLEDVDHSSVLARLDEIRARLAASEPAAGDVPTTASFGVAECQPDHSLSQMLAHADSALYEAKREGRDRVVVFSG